MNKADLTNAVAERFDMTKTRAAEIVDAFFCTETGIITGALKGGEEVKIHGFGVFSVLRRDARDGFNPKTGKKIKIEAVNSPKFRSGSGLKGALK